MCHLERLLPFSKNFARFMVAAGVISQIFEGETVPDKDRKKLKNYVRFVSKLPLTEATKHLIVNKRVNKKS